MNYIKKEYCKDANAIYCYCLSEDQDDLIKNIKTHTISEKYGDEQVLINVDYLKGDKDYVVFGVEMLNTTPDQADERFEFAINKFWENKSPQ